MFYHTYKNERQKTVMTEKKITVKKKKFLQISKTLQEWNCPVKHHCTNMLLKIEAQTLYFEQGVIKVWRTFQGYQLVCSQVPLIAGSWLKCCVEKASSLPLNSARKSTSVYQLCLPRARDWDKGGPMSHVCRLRNVNPLALDFSCLQLKPKSK